MRERVITVTLCLYDATRIVWMISNISWVLGCSDFLCSFENVHSDCAPSTNLDGAKETRHGFCLINTSSHY